MGDGKGNAVAGVIARMRAAAKSPKDDGGEPAVPKPHLEKKAKLPKTQERPVATESDEPIQTPVVPVTRAHLGRPLGSKAGAKRPKSKATIAIDAELMEQYRNWSWEDRVLLGDLITAAMQTYYKKHHQGK
jgi:hypothetical protein